MAKTERERAFEAFMASNKKKYGESAAKLDTDVPASFEHVSTGSILLDDALGIGGFPMGRIIELFGNEGSGKTSLATIVAGNAQRKYDDRYAAWIDVENSLNWHYAQQLGMIKNKTVFSQPSAGEQALDEMTEMAASGAFSVIVLDSVAGLQTKRQLEKELDEDTIGEVARLMSKAMPGISEAARRTNTMVIFINQLRTNIGAYGGPSQTMGGKALRFFASQRIDVKKDKPLMNGVKDFIGQDQVYTVKKNRMGTPFKVVETEFFFGKGFNAFKELIDISLKVELIEKGGAWYYPHPEDKSLKFQGKENLIQYYVDNFHEFEILKVKYAEYRETGLLSEVIENVEAMEDINEPD